MAFLSPTMAADLRGFGRGLLSQSFTKLPQTGFEGLGAGAGFAEENRNALIRQQQVAQQAAALEQQRGITNAQADQRIGISGSQLGISQGNLAVAQGGLAVKQAEDAREAADAAREQKLFNDLTSFSQGAAPGAAPAQTPAPAAPQPQSAVPPGIQPAPLPPQAAAPQTPPGQVLSDAGPQGIPLQAGQQFAALQQQPEQPVTQGRVAPEIAARHIPDQRLAQAAQTKPHPDPQARVAQAIEPTFMGMNRQQAGEFVRIKQMLGDAQAGQFLNNIRTQQNKAAERGTLSQKDKFAVEDRMHAAFAKRTNVAKYNEASALYDGMLETVNDPSGQADIDLVFATANILDPGSVVREGEAATVFGAGGVGGWAQNWAGWLASGNRLNAKDRAALLRVADRRVRSYRKPAERAAGKASALAKRRGLTPGGVVRTDYTGANHRAPTKAEDMNADVQGIGLGSDETTKPSITPKPSSRTRAAPRATQPRAAQPTMTPAQFREFMKSQRRGN